jgi:hypothetical protein
MRLRHLACAVLIAGALGGTAEAGVCEGEPPPGTATFRGPVLHVLDGERLCVALGADPASWVEVRLADAPHTAQTDRRGGLMAASFGQDVTCRIVARQARAILAQCASDKGSIGRLLQAPRLIKAGQAWR